MKKILFIILFAVLLFSFLENVSAAGIVGVSPGNILFKDVLRGGYAERYITVTINSEEPVKIKLEPRGEIKDWLNFSENISVSKNNPARILVSVNPPTDIPNGNYTGFLRISTESLGSSKEGHALSTVRAVLDVTIAVKITDLEILQCRANNFKVYSAEKGDKIKFDVDILNKGNVRLKPDISIDIWDQDQISIVKSTKFKGNEILPTKEKILNFYMLTNDLPINQYWVDMNAPDCFSSETLTFDILEPGTLKANGILTGILSKIWANVDETIPIIVNFRNIGEKNVDSRFKGKITKDGKIIQLLESEKTTAPMGKITNFTFFFTPRKSGKYIASGRVFYDKKRTFELSTIINVNPKKFGFKYISLILIYFVIVFFIIILFHKIRKEKRRYLNKIKKIKNGN